MASRKQHPAELRERAVAMVFELRAALVGYGQGLAGRLRALARGGVDAALDVARSGALPELIELAGGPVAYTFPFAEVAQAQRVSEQGHMRGMLVLLVG